MKKILIVLMMVLLLGACAPSSTTDNQDDIDKLYTDFATLQAQIDAIEDYNDTELWGAIDEIELSILALQERIDNLVVTKGLNGQTSIYENQSVYTAENNPLTRLSTSLTQLKDTFDKNKTAPAYIVDIDGTYVSFRELGYRLKTKYFGNSSVHGEEMFDIGSKALIKIFFTSDMSNEEVLARSILFIEELRLYEFYILSCPELELRIYRQDSYDHKVIVNIPLVVMINDYFDITPDGIISGDYEMSLFVTDNGLNQSLTEQYYNSFVNNNTFEGYVLNWGK